MSSYPLVRHLLCLVALVAALGLASVARAGEATGPEAFYGRYQGTGITQDPNAMAFGFDNRDLDVEIGPAEGGFFVAWTTVMRSLGDKEIKRSSARIDFEPSGRPGIYIEHAPATRNAEGFSWASISGGALTVRRLAILEDGSYEVQSYERSLTKDGLFLFFRSDRDGAVIKIVTARLQKQTQ